jgi:hypothetical protein
MDRTIFTTEGALEIARTGCFMEYDLFGGHVAVWLFALAQIR